MRPYQRHVMHRGGIFWSAYSLDKALATEEQVQEAVLSVREAPRGAAHPQRQTPAGQSNDPTARLAGGHLTVIRGGRDE